MPDRSTNENKAVEAYLQYLATGVVPVDPDLQDKLDLLTKQIAEEDRLHVKVKLIAERRRLDQPAKADPLIERFINYALTFGERNNIDYATWREMGVPAAVLKQAGVKITYVTRAPRGEGTRPPGRPGVARRKMTPEFRAEYVAYWEEHGRAATAEHYDYASNYAYQVYKESKEALSHA